MPETIKGIVLREIAFGENDKILTLLSREHGKISVYAGGAKKFKSHLFSSCQLFAYAEFTVSPSKDRYYIREASEIECFFGLRNTLKGAALASYIAEVALDISLEEHEESELTRLVLNCFHCISNGSKPDYIIKSVFELRVLSSLGYMPDLVGCAGCGRGDVGEYFFDVGNGCFRCPDCYHKTSSLSVSEAAKQNELEGIYGETSFIVPISQSTLSAMRYAVFSPIARMFSFDVKDEAKDEFSSVCEKYLLCHLERDFPSLDFYKSII